MRLGNIRLVNYIGIVASDILVEAINNGIKNAESIGGFRAFRDIK